MDTRNQYPLEPIAPAGSPALSDPAHSSMIPACQWESIGEYSDIKLEISTGEDAGIAKITINRPEKRNAFRPQLNYYMHSKSSGTIQKLVWSF